MNFIPFFTIVAFEMCVHMCERVDYEGSSGTAINCGDGDKCARCRFVNVTDRNEMNEEIRDDHNFQAMLPPRKARLDRTNGGQRPTKQMVARQMRNDGDDIPEEPANNKQFVDEYANQASGQGYTMAVMSSVNDNGAYRSENLNVKLSSSNEQTFNHDVNNVPNWHRIKRTISMIRLNPKLPPHFLPPMHQIREKIWILQQKRREQAMKRRQSETNELMLLTEMWSIKLKDYISLLLRFILS